MSCSVQQINQPLSMPWL